MEAKKTLVFDFDGTIADTLPRILTISNRLAPDFGYRQVPDDEIEMLRSVRSREALKLLQIPMLRIPAIAIRMKAELQKEMHLIQPISSMKEVLGELKTTYQLGIVTSNSQPNVERFLEANGMAFFEFIYSSSSLFGKTRVLKRLLKQHQVKRQEMAYVGDETRDIDAARKTGIDMIAVSWGANTADALARLNPQHLIHHPDGLLALLSR
ncbi:HAD-IA family hydrolase [Tunicatimonas pelagia]|uniref:HAD-IA family hydrolase n=1 Tax=Tunicatimonas pelagia TaxID=931531 RepID=UPI002665D54B|nr:HAD-IA family hydrolase [Tunicatimonas pelagia]WKN41643.1 HAD-IA family hydrolase [Tunicatimonas pelagia]